MHAVDGALRSYAWWSMHSYLLGSRGDRGGTIGHREGGAAQAITRARTVFRPLCNRHDIALSAVSRPTRSMHRRSGFPSDFSVPTRSSHDRSRAAGARSTDPRDGIRAPAGSGIRFRRATSRAGSAPAFAPPRPAPACVRGGVGASFLWPSTCTGPSIAPARGLIERSSARRRPGARRARRCRPRLGALGRQPVRGPSWLPSG